FLWRATGLLDGNVHAYPDRGEVASPDGGTAIASVLANDWVNGVHATTANVTLSQISSSSPKVSLGANGSVVVAAGVSAGAHSLVYQICDIGNGSHCDASTATITVNPYVIHATNDQGTASPSTGGTAIANVLANDTLGAAIATVSTVQLSLVSVSP